MKLHIDKKIFINWKTYVCLFAFALIMSIVLYDYLEAIINIKNITYKEKDINGQVQEFYSWGYIKSIVTENDISSNNKVVFDRGGYTVYFFSFFTMQSNILIALWFLTMGLFNNYEGKIKILSINFAIALGAYIVTTMIVYNAMILPTQYQTMTILDWFLKMALHAVIPIGFIVFILFVLNPQEVLSVKEYIKQKLLILYIYPIIYLAYCLIRGEFRYGQGAPLTQYPYFFLRIHDKNVFPGVNLDGWVWLIIAITFVLSIISLFSISFVWVLNKRKEKMLTVSLMPNRNNSNL